MGMTGTVSGPATTRRYLEIHVTGRRIVAAIVNGLFGYLLGYRTVPASPRRQRLSDMAARTLVVRA